MVWRFGKASFAEDLGYAFTWVQAFETAKRHVFDERDLVLVGHSAGGGLSQYFLSWNMGTVGGLVIMAGFPSWGG
jgi:predicted alpha/beta hydrolase family esterase